MRIFSDEGVDASIVARLRQEGHDVDYAAEIFSGFCDEAVLGQANRRNALFLTTGKDFGELVFRLRRTAAGVVFIRLEGSESEKSPDLAPFGNELSGRSSSVKV